MTTRFSSISRLVTIIQKPGFWFILATIVLLTMLHYAESQEYPGLITQLIANIGLGRHAFERILFMAPIVWAGFLFGWRGAFATSLVALACMLPRALFISASQTDAIFETSAVFIIGNVLAISFASLRKEREYRSQLEIAHQELKTHIQAIKDNERRLASLNQISSTISQSLELGQVLNLAIDNVVDVMQVDAAWIFLLNEETRELELSAHRGFSEEFARGIDRLKIGEGFSGMVAKTGKPLFAEDASQDSRLVRDVLIKYNVHSLLAVPLSAKGEVNGTLSIAMHSHRMFQEEEIEQLTAIGNQIGVAVENARLYQRQQEAVDQLGKMQENLRFYLQQVTKAQEEERKRISHELHDETIQALVVLSRRLDTLASDKKGLPEEHRHNLEEIWQQTNDVIREVRRLSQDLRPAALDRLGLVPALEWLASEAAEYSGINTNVSVLGNVRRFPGEVELVLFRITQEALRNVWRHSSASTAKIKVEFEEDKVRITVSDNGKGFKIPERMVDYARDGKLGLAGMQERAQLIGGTLKVSSREGEGTDVVIESSF
jgi:two-component system sensor histidine kinase DegS